MNLKPETLSTAISEVARRRHAPPSAMCFAVQEGENAASGGGNGEQNRRDEWVVKTLEEFVDKVANFMFNVRPMSGLGRADRDIPKMLWRGQLDGETLVPSAFRADEPNIEVAVGRAQMFKNMAPAIYGKCPGSDEHFKWLTLMQHHGLPTCLLDWSDSPLVALFFALNREDRRGKNGKREHTKRVVWGLDAGRLNGTSRGHPEEPIMLSPDHPDVADAAKNFFRGDASEDTRAFAMSARYLDRQQMAQQSRYTIHRDRTPLKKQGDKGIEILPVRIVIPPMSREDMRIHLLEMGILRRHLFPDLRGLAEGVKEESNWWRRGDL